MGRRRARRCVRVVNPPFDLSERLDVRRSDEAAGYGTSPWNSPLRRERDCSNTVAAEFREDPRPEKPVLFLPPGPHRRVGKQHGVYRDSFKQHRRTSFDRRRHVGVDNAKFERTASMESQIYFRSA